jgi:thiamine-monophosphate kinase
VSAPGEFEIIARYFTRRNDRADVLLGVGDDAAVLECPGQRKLVVAMDTIVEGVHFPKDTDAADIGYRALAVNLSDLAAMGAEPAWMTLSLSLPGSDSTWLQGFASGLFELADRHGVALVGGDTVRGPLVVTVQIAGLVEPDAWLTRAGAKPGDLVFVSGVPGEAAAGLELIQRNAVQGDAARHLRQRFLRPEPRVGLGRELRSVASAAMDVSDGLLVDLRKLCAASGCGMQLNVDALPQSAPMLQLMPAAECIEHALAGGDDYEIIFTVPASRAQRVRDLRSAPCTQIGAIVAGDAVLCSRGGAPFEPRRRGYDHFEQGPGSP